MNNLGISENFIFYFCIKNNDVISIKNILVVIYILALLYKLCTRGAQLVPNLYKLCTKDFQEIYNWDTPAIQGCIHRLTMKFTSNQFPNLPTPCAQYWIPLVHMSGQGSFQVVHNYSEYCG